MERAVLHLAVALILGDWQATAQSSGLVFHRVGPVTFTNSTAFGYADGQLASTNFYCGLYAGTDADSLGPYFIGAPSFRQRLGTFFTTFYGNIALVGPTNSPIFLQFRIWPSDFGTYEEARAFGTPTPPVGVTGISLAIPPDIIVEFPVGMGQIWLEPIPEPSAVSLLLLGSMGVAALKHFHSRTRSN